jgi:glycosyltransferase involved in cell wall biosynthesis
MAEARRAEPSLACVAIARPAAAIRAAPSVARADRGVARLDPPLGDARVRRLRVGIYDHHWSTLGGGELVDASLAEILACDHDVTLVGPTPVDAGAIRERLGPDVSGCRFLRAGTETEVTALSATFDLFVNGAFLSKAVNRAPVGYYYVMFPQARPTLARRITSAAARTALRAIGGRPRPAGRINALRQRLALRVDDARFAPTYHRFLSDSRFTAHWVTRLWKVSSEVLYPPVRPLVVPRDKRPVIVSIGRFFDPSKGHSKKQREMVDAFARLVASGRANGWELVLIGGCDAANRDYLLELKRRAVGLPVRFAVNASGRVVTDTLAEAAIYWHAGGYGEDADRHPERLEHFGIAVVEACAAGAVPVVFGAAGPAEIVRDGQDGVHWWTLEALASETAALIESPARRDSLAGSAIARARDFSAEVFADNVRRILEADFGGR